MFGADHYVPILMGKGGEYRALRNLDPEVKEAMTPLIEVPDIPWDWEEDEPRKSVDEHLSPVPGKLEDHWGPETPLFLDLTYLPPDDRLADGRHPLTFLLEEGLERDLTLIPVTGLRRPEGHDEAVREAVAVISRVDGHPGGVCIRLITDDFADPESLEEELDQTLANLDVASEDTDILMDLGPIDPSQRTAHRIVASQVMSQLPSAQAWRTVTFAATAFPQTMQPFDQDSVNLVERTEWALWKHLMELYQKGKLQRLPTFGDYTINHPEPVEIDPRVMRMSASIRYTADEHWLIMRGHWVEKPPYFGQFHELSRDLVDRDEYCGPDFSSGDQYIQDCAAEDESTGNATTWRRVGTNHHLTFVVNQIATLDGV